MATNAKNQLWLCILLEKAFESRPEMLDSKADIFSKFLLLQEGSCNVESL